MQGDVTGSASAVLLISSAAIGTRTVTAAAGIAISSSGAIQAIVAHLATASGSVTVTATAAGNVTVSGATSGNLAAAGQASGTVTHVGSCSAALVLVGAISAVRAVLAQANGGLLIVDSVTGESFGGAAITRRVVVSLDRRSTVRTTGAHTRQVTALGSDQGRILVRKD